MQGFADDRFYLDVLRRIQAAPSEHLGRRSFAKLCSFHFGYSCFRPNRMAQDSSFLQIFREWLVARYDFDTVAMSMEDMLTAVAESDERAFELFFNDLESFFLANPSAVKRKSVRFIHMQPIPASAEICRLAQRPPLFFPDESVGRLRAHLDGYALAAIESGNESCSDLEGFEHWVRKQLGLKGLFRWEHAILQHFHGDQRSAFHWAMEGLQSFCEARGLRRYYDFSLVDLEELRPTSE